MNPKRALFKVVIGFILASVLLCFILTAAVFWMADPFHFKAPSDQKLSSIFRTHRETFEKLQQMATEDARYGWYFNSPDLEGSKLDEAHRREYENDPRYAWYFKSPYFEGNSLNKSRAKEYKNLVSEIRPGLAISTDYDSSMRFIFAGGGFAIGPDWLKGIEYVPRSYESNVAVYGIWEENGTNYQQWQGVISTDLDNARTLPANVYLRPIESNWFIIYQRDD